MLFRHTQRVQLISLKKSFDNTKPELDSQYFKLSIIRIFSK